MADQVFIRGEGGSVFIMDLPLHEAIEDRLRKGYLTRVNEDGSAFIEGLPTSRPNVNASKAEWVGWSVAQGMTPDDAEALTKTDLIEKFGVAAKTPDEVAAEAAALAEKEAADAAALAAGKPLE
jgi:hypothetical protein